MLWLMEHQQMRGGRGRVLHAGCGQTRAQFRRHAENYSPGSHPGKKPWGFPGTEMAGPVEDRSEE